MGTRGCVIAIMVVGCGGGGGTTDAPRADAPAPDAQVDASPDARIDAAPPGPGEYVVDSMAVPTSSTEVQELGMDIDSDQPDGDAGVDNQFGSILAALATMNFDVQASVNHGVDFGTAITLLYFDPAMNLASYVGVNPNPPACTGPGDTVCRQHLDGNAGFDVAGGVPTGTMPTVTVSSITTGGPGTAVVQIAVFGGTPLTLDLIGARFRGTIDAVGITNGKLAGAIPRTFIDSDVIPALGDQIRATVAADCPTASPPTCSCTPGSTGENFISLFDTNDDCVVSDDELRNDPLINGFFMPDVTIDGVDALSFGFGVTAVPGSFSPP